MAMSETEYFQSLEKVDEVKKYLHEIKSLEKRIKNKQDELQQLWCLTTSITAPTDREPIQLSGVTDKVGNGVVKMQEIEAEIKVAIVTFIYEKNRRIKLIETLENPIEYTVVYEHYVNYKKLSQIAEEENFCSQYISEVHRNALKKLTTLQNL